MPSMSQLLGSKRFSFLTGSDSTSSSHLLAATREDQRVQVSLLIMTDGFFLIQIIWQLTLPVSVTIRATEVLMIYHYESCLGQQTDILQGGQGVRQKTNILTN